MSERSFDSQGPRAPSVSVVIPCHNYGRFLGDAIESALAQTHDALEVTVVDCESTDETSDVVAAYPQIRCIRRPNLGLGAARNDGLQVSNGAFVVFLDADDKLLPTAVATSLASLQLRTDCGFAYGHQRFFDATGLVARGGPSPHGCLDGDAYGHMLRTNNPLRTTGALLYRREILDKLGGFARDLDGCEDIDLNLRLARDHPICCNDRVVLMTRVHEVNMTRRWGHMLAKAVAAQKRQRPYVREHPEYKADYRTGLRLARTYWGGHLVDAIADDVAAGERRRALRDAARLARYHPAGIVHLGRKLIARRILRERRSAGAPGRRDDESGG